MKDHLGHFYDKTSDFQQTQFNTLRKLIEDGMSEDERASVTSMIDVGCGSGARTVQCFDIFPNLKRVLAVDPDPDMIEAARQAHFDPRIEYKQTDGEGLDDLVFPPFDFVIANWSLHWVENKTKLFDGLTYLTKPGSRVAFSTCETLPEILQFIDDYIRREFHIISEKPPFYYLNQEGWKNFLTEKEWPVKILKAFPLIHNVDDARQYLDHWFTASAAKFMYGRHIMQLSSLSHDELVSLMKRIYPAHDNPQGLSFVEQVMFVLAQRS